MEMLQSPLAVADGERVLSVDDLAAHPMRPPKRNARDQ
jgi:hypothetical protein